MKDEKISFAKDVETGKDITTTIKDIIANRILWEGDSGSGKSHGMVGMIEKTDGLAQRIIIDPEGEYFPLKDNFQFLLIGQKTEQVTPNVVLNLNDVYVDKLVKKLIEISSDAIIDLSENAGEATHFLKIFQIAVFKYAKLMKRPLLIFVDEGQIFAPEKGQGKEESLKAMKELAKRGRKRGIGLICGTQAIADFSKDVVRQLRTRFIGNCTYDNDVKAAAHFLGFGKEREPELRELAGEDQHHFFVSGKGIRVAGERPKQVIKIEANENKTKLYDFDFNKNFKLKERDAAVMSELAANFNEIPQLIDEELSEKETLQKNNFEFKKQLQEQKIKINQLERQQPKQDPQAIEKAYNDGYSKALRHTKLQYDKKLDEAQKLINILSHKLGSISHKAKELLEHTVLPGQTKIEIPELEQPKPIEIKQTIPTPIKTTVSPISDSPTVITNSDQIQLGRCETMCLTALAQRGKASSKVQIATLAGYSFKSGGFNNAISRLKSCGYINNQGTDLEITQEGLNIIGDYTPIPEDHDSLLAAWKSKLARCPATLLEIICKAYPDEITKETLALESHYSSGSGGFNNGISKLNSLGLITRSNGNLKASAEMFP